MRAASLVAGSALLLAVGPLLAACGSSTSTASADSTGSGLCHNGKITVGLAKALSGTFAVNDQADANGVKLAIDEANAAGGIGGCKIVTISGDTKSDPAVGGQVAQDLISKGAQIMVVPADFDLGIAAAQATERAGLLGFAPSASSVQFAPAVGPHFFTGAITSDLLGESAAKYALSRHWMTTYMVVDQAFNYFTDQAKAFEKVYEAGGGKVIGQDSTQPSQQDYSATVSKIASSGASFVYGDDFYPVIGAFIKQLRAAGVASPVLGNQSASSPDLPKVVGTSQIANVSYIAQVYWEGAGADPAVASFLSAYQKKFGAKPTLVNALTGYQVTKAVLAAVKQAGTTNADAVTKALDSQQNLSVAGSTLEKWDAGHAVWKPVVVGFDSKGAFEQLPESFN